MARIFGVLGEGAEGFLDRMTIGFPRGRDSSGAAFRAARGDLSMRLERGGGSFESECIFSADGTSCVDMSDPRNPVHVPNLPAHG